MKRIYNKQGWVLAECTVCGRTNYVEPHDCTAPCKCCPTRATDHKSISFARRDESGCFLLDRAR